MSVATKRMGKVCPLVGLGEISSGNGEAVVCRCLRSFVFDIPIVIAVVT